MNDRTTAKSSILERFILKDWRRAKASEIQLSKMLSVLHTIEGTMYPVEVDVSGLVGSLQKDHPYSHN